MYRVANLRGRSVSWIRQNDLQVLTTNAITFTTDKRFSVEGYNKGAAAVWDLHLSDVTQADEGVYQCQVNTRPKIFHPVRLHVVEGRAHIAGPQEVYLHAGSRLLLTCWLLAPPHPPPLVWTHNSTVLNDTTTRGGLSLFMSHEGARASTRLSLQRVDARDAGNYTCHPRDLPAASVSVYVLLEKEPAAMHYDASTSLHQTSAPVLLLLLLTAPLVSMQLSFVYPFLSATSQLKQFLLPKIVNVAMIAVSFLRFIVTPMRSCFTRERKPPVNVKYSSWVGSTLTCSCQFRLLAILKGRPTRNTNTPSMRELNWSAVPPRNIQVPAILILDRYRPRPTDGRQLPGASNATRRCAAKLKHLSSKRNLNFGLHLRIVDEAPEPIFIVIVI
ncbi:uncharacterized protein LOC108671449 [Hyalella azteca]|uniref:Uncharacterized protein LOC108671449 n=1 Tax=Hyalella azteca TaxID=294128 RepID=A0A979FU74_HYAAZ|nr:uncharacterized protein LOC108671449 [Hyalella azteca]